jgi:endo-1,4-beta-xylanase
MYDVLGREVGVLVDGTLPPGTYEVYWDAANFPSGVYVYRLEVGSHNSARKMLLLH